MNARISDNGVALPIILSDWLPSFVRLSDCHASYQMAAYQKPADIRGALLCPVSRLRSPTLSPGYIFLIHAVSSPSRLADSLPVDLSTSNPAMAPNVFSVSIFLLVFRETLEAAVIVSVLLGLVKQIVSDDTSPLHSTIDENQPTEGDVDDAARKRRLLRKLRIQVRSLRLVLSTRAHVTL